MLIPPRPADRKAAAQREMWATTPLADQPLFVVYYRKSWGYGSCRKYVSGGGRGFTENRYKAWKTTDRAEAERRAANLEGGRVAEFKP